MTTEIANPFLEARRISHDPSLPVADRFRGAGVGAAVSRMAVNSLRRSQRNSPRRAGRSAGARGRCSDHGSLQIEAQLVALALADGGLQLGVLRVAVAAL